MAASVSGAVPDRLGRSFRDLRVSVTDRCNFRCPYCMPAAVFGEGYEFLPSGRILTFEEIERLARVFAGMGVTKIRITGGEPLLRAEISKLVALLARIEGVEDLTLTTNGYLLAERAGALKEAGLNRVTVSLDSLDDDVFNQMSGRDHGARRVLEGIEAALKAGLCPVKINCVVQRGVNDHTIIDLVRRFKDADTIVRFIEYMDVGNSNHWTMDGVVTAAEIIERIG
ncbi:MAG: radical SAM protein, partial [Chloroflexi bacterium]|nr:radical SAM protein [Chloroflexota bacterium]